MQTTAKDTYASVQARLMFFAYMFVTVMSIVVMILESYNLANPSSTVSQLIIILSIFLGIMYSQIAMLLVEIVFQDEIKQFPLVSYLARLAPELTVRQRFTYLFILFRRQTTSLVSLMVAWIIIGGTHRAAALVFSMAMITMFTLYGTHYMERLHTLNLEHTESSGNVTDDRMSLDD